MSATVNTTKAPKTASVLTPEIITALGALAADKEALKVALQQTPELESVMADLQAAAADASSPKALATKLGLPASSVLAMTDWMFIEKGKSTYIGTEGKIADRSFASRFVVPTKKLADAGLKAKLEELSVKVFSYAVQEAAAMGITSI